MLSPQRDHGHARAWIDASSDEEQIAELRALFWRFEREVPASIADDTVDGTSIGGVTSLDVEWRPEILDDNVAPQIRKAQTFELVEAELFECDVVFARVRMTIVDSRNMRQNLDVVAAGRGLGGIGAGRRDHIEGGIVWHPALAKDATKVSMQILRVEKVVMRELRINSVQSKMEDDTGAGGLKTAKPLHDGSR